MLTFEMDHTDGRLDIHGDGARLRKLIDQLELVLAEDRDPAGVGPAHTHLMTPAWGGSKLSDGAQGTGDVINHVKIYCWPPEPATVFTRSRVVSRNRREPLPNGPDLVAFNVVKATPVQALGALDPDDVHRCRRPASRAAWEAVPRASP